MQFETILPFLRPTEHLILDPDISEIMVNAGSRIFVEKRGQLTPVPDITISEQALCAAGRRSICYRPSTLAIQGASARFTPIPHAKLSPALQ